MSKLLAALAAGLFSVAVFAQTTPAAPMSGASGTKAEAKAPVKKAGTKVAKKSGKKSARKASAKAAPEPKKDKN